LTRYVIFSTYVTSHLMEIETTINTHWEYPKQRIWWSPIDFLASVRSSIPASSSSLELRTMCGSRTGGWSLPGVMSDWQRCVDWFLAKYCRCRLRLDWCWCRWRTSVKRHCRWGLQVWRRQVGFVRGTRWPAESSAGRMVARTARWSHGWFLGRGSKPRSSRDYVGVESWVAIGRGYTEFMRFPVVHQKTTGFFGWSTKPRPKNRRRRCSSIGPVWPVGLTGLTGVRRRSPETLMQRTHVGIARLASRLSKFAVAGHPYDGAMTKTSEFALEGHVSLVS
jgi:hypothetical protein